MPSKDGRVLHRSISVSRSMADLEDPSAILVATWLIPWGDDQGRMLNDPRWIKAQVFPLVDKITLTSIASAVERMAAVGMICAYTADDGTELLQFLSWWTWNDGQRRAYPSKYPAPPGWQDRVRTWKDELPQTAADCGRLPQSAARSRSRSGELGDGNGTGGGAGAGAPAAGAAVTFESVCADYAAAFGIAGPLDAQLLEEAAREYPPWWIHDAILEAVAHNARNWSYARKILERWQREGHVVGSGSEDEGGGAARRAALEARAAALRAEEERRGA